MLKVYALLINKWMNELQYNFYLSTESDYIEYDKKQSNYSQKMDKLYKRLQREHGFNKEKFYSLQDQAVMF